jgi:hypothetical protein
MLTGHDGEALYWKLFASLPLILPSIVLPDGHQSSCRIIGDKALDKPPF